MTQKISSVELYFGVDEQMLEALRALKALQTAKTVSPLVY
jgi:hypothetical protein